MSVLWDEIRPQQVERHRNQAEFPILKHSSFVRGDMWSTERRLLVLQRRAQWYLRRKYPVLEETVSWLQRERILAYISNCEGNTSRI
jgi:hypothetical protein